MNKTPSMAGTTTLSSKLVLPCLIFLSDHIFLRLQSWCGLSLRSLQVPAGCSTYSDSAIHPSRKCDGDESLLLPNRSTKESPEATRVYHERLFLPARQRLFSVFPSFGFPIDSCSLLAEFSMAMTDVGPCLHAEDFRKEVRFRHRPCSGNSGKSM